MRVLVVSALNYQCTLVRAEHFKLLREERGYNHSLKKKAQLAMAAKIKDARVQRRQALETSEVSLRAMNRMIDHLIERKAVLTKMFRDYDKDQVEPVLYNVCLVLHCYSCSCLN